MNICLLTNTYLPHVGGVARSVATLAEDLEAAGHKVLIIAPTFDDDSSANRQEPNVIRVPAIQNFNGSDFSVRLPIPFQLGEALDGFKPDIIHSHHPFLLGDTALRIARRYRKPLVFTHHTLYERYTHYVPMDSDAMQQFAIHLAIEYTNLCDAVIARSESIARLIRERGTTRPISVIPTGVDTGFFAAGKGSRFRKAWGIAPQTKVIGHLGRLAEEKNLRFLADAVTRVLQQQPQARFILAGEGELKQELQDYFAEQQVAEQVIITGNCSGRELADAYGAMDLFAFSSHTETQGMVITEAMAAGNPVVALEASGVREVVKDQHNGYLLNADATPQQFAEALGRLTEAPDTLKQMSANALKTAADFSRENSARKMLQLYHSLTCQEMSDSLYSEKIGALEKLTARLKAEWELISEKSAAAAKAFTETTDINKQFL